MNSKIIINNLFSAVFASNNPFLLAPTSRGWELPKEFNWQLQMCGDILLWTIQIYIVACGKNTTLDVFRDGAKPRIKNLVYISKKIKFKRASVYSDS